MPHPPYRHVRDAARHGPAERGYAGSWRSWDLLFGTVRPLRLFRLRSTLSVTAAGGRRDSAESRTAGRRNSTVGNLRVSTAELSCALSGGSPARRIACLVPTPA